MCPIQWQTNRITILWAGDITGIPIVVPPSVRIALQWLVQDDFGFFKFGNVAVFFKACRLCFCFFSQPQNLPLVRFQAFSSNCKCAVWRKGLALHVRHSWGKSFPEDLSTRLESQGENHPKSLMQTAATAAQPVKTCGNEFCDYFSHFCFNSS